MAGVWARIRWLGRTAMGAGSAVVAGGLIALVRAYQLTISPLLIGSCKFRPTCSEYFIEAVRAHGCLRGSLMGLWRICRCNPFSEGGIDPVPPPRSPHRRAGSAD